MKFCWLSQNNSSNLIVFFAGWSFDETPFKTLKCDGFDVLFVYDYNEISELEILKNISEKYEHKILICWSMGVFVAASLRKYFENFDKKFAINGTVTPVDNEFGIPVKMFELTLKHASVGLGGKFYKNVYKTEEELEKYSQNPVKRTIEDRVSELENLYEFIKSHEVNGENFYDFAVVSEFDKIIPPKNQIASHTKFDVPIKTIECGHSPFFGFSEWREIVELCR